MSGLHSASYLEESRNRIKAYIQYLEGLEDSAFTQHIIDSLDTPEAKKVFENRTFLQLGLEDCLNMVETLVQDLPDRKRVLPAYHELLKARYGEDRTEADALRHLNAQCLKLKNGQAFPMNTIPIHVALFTGHIAPEQFSATVDLWLKLADDIAYTINDQKDHLPKVRNRFEELEINTRNDEEEIIQNYQYTEDITLSDKVNDEENQQTGNQPAPNAASLAAAAFEKLLDAYGEDLTRNAGEKDTKEILHRENEIRQLTATIMKPHNAYALCVGGPGAGKSSIVEELAHKIATDDVPEKLKNARIVRLKLRDMKASSGQGEAKDSLGKRVVCDMSINRFHEILMGAAIYNTENKNQIILDIDELATMGDRLPVFQAKNVLAAAMDDYPNLRIIGEISDTDFHALEKDSPKMVEKFQNVSISPLDDEKTLSVLKSHIAGTMLANTDEQLLKKTIQLTNRYTPAIKQPGSALEVLEAAVSFAELDGAELGKDHVEEVVSNKSGLSKEMIGSSISERIATLGETLPKMVLGQEKPIKKIVGSMKVANAGLNNPNKPLGSYMLVGPTGVGKTETAKALAESLGIPLITEHMEKYKEKHAKSLLVGAPPGYVGYQEKAAFEKVAEAPSCVFLLDEIEKAHDDIFEALLSVLDEGEAQLMNGRTVSFKNCIILMTSNLGEKAAQLAKAKREMGFSTKTEEEQKREAEDSADEVREKAIKDRLPPEFINRLDGILKYDSLKIEVARNIALQKIAKVSAFLQDKNHNLNLEVSQEAMDQLVSAGYDEEYGARTMDRAIKDLIKEPLAEWILENSASITEPTTLLVKELETKGPEKTDLEGKFDLEVKRVANGPAHKP